MRQLGLRWSDGLRHCMGHDCAARHCSSALGYTLPQTLEAHDHFEDQLVLLLARVEQQLQVEDRLPTAQRLPATCDAACHTACKIRAAQSRAGRGIAACSIHMTTQPSTARTDPVGGGCQVLTATRACQPTLRRYSCTGTADGGVTRSTRSTLSAKSVGGGHWPLKASQRGAASDYVNPMPSQS